MRTAFPATAGTHGGNIPAVDRWIPAFAGNAGVGEGDRVSVSGAVQKAPSAQQAKQQWHLDDDAAKRLEGQGVYLSGTQVEKVNR